MDFDAIDAAGTAAIFQDGAKSATLMLPSGVHCAVKLWLTPVIEAFDAEDDSSAEQRWAISLENEQGRGEPGAKVLIGAITYELIRRLDGDLQITTWEVRKRG